MNTTTNLYSQHNLKTGRLMLKRRAEAHQRSTPPRAVHPQETFRSSSRSAQATIKAIKKSSQSEAVTDFTPAQIEALKEIKASPASGLVPSWMKFGLQNPSHLEMAFQQVTQVPTLPSGIARASRVALVESEGLAEGNQKAASLLGSAVSLAHLENNTLDRDSIGQVALDLLALSQQSERENLGSGYSNQIAESGLKTMRGLVLSRADADLKLVYPSKNQAQILTLVELANWKSPEAGNQTLFPQLEVDLVSQHTQDNKTSKVKKHTLPRPGSSKSSQGFFQRICGKSEATPALSSVLKDYANDVVQGHKGLLSIEGSDVYDQDRFATQFGESEEYWSKTETALAKESPLLESEVSKAIFADTTRLDRPGQRGKLVESLGFEAKTQRNFNGLNFTIFQPPGAGVYEPAVINMEAIPSSQRGDTTFFISDFSKADSILRSKDKNPLQEMFDVSQMALLSSAIEIQGSPGESGIGMGPSGNVDMPHGAQNKACFRVHTAALMDKALKDVLALSFQQPK